MIGICNAKRQFYVSNRYQTEFHYCLYSAAAQCYDFVHTHAKQTEPTRPRTTFKFGTWSDSLFICIMRLHRLGCTDLRRCKGDMYMRVWRSIGRFLRPNRRDVVCFVARGIKVHKHREQSSFAGAMIFHRSLASSAPVIRSFRERRAANCYKLRTTRPLHRWFIGERV